MNMLWLFPGGSLKGTLAPRTHSNHQPVRGSYQVTHNFTSRVRPPWLAPRTRRLHQQDGVSKAVSTSVSSSLIRITGLLRMESLPGPMAPAVRAAVPVHVQPDGKGLMLDNQLAHPYTNTSDSPQGQPTRQGPRDHLSHRGHLLGHCVLRHSPLSNLKFTRHKT